MKKHGFEILQVSSVPAPLDVLKESWLKRWLQQHISKGDTTCISFLSSSIILLVK